jgi:[ribosomal protein S5]-alanine N-acetyltransferase
MTVSRLKDIPGIGVDKVGDATQRWRRVIVAGGGEEHAGKGFMGAAIAILLDHAFDSMRLNRIEAACIPRNERSIHVLEKAGFQREGLLRSYLRINGTWQDHFLYAITAQDHARAKRG